MKEEKKALVPSHPRPRDASPTGGEFVAEATHNIPGAGGWGEGWLRVGKGPVRCI
jgi:hypothetical protein